MEQEPQLTNGAVPVWDGELGAPGPAVGPPVRFGTCLAQGWAVVTRAPRSTVLLGGLFVLFEVAALVLFLGGIQSSGAYLMLLACCLAPLAVPLSLICLVGPLAVRALFEVGLVLALLRPFVTGGYDAQDLLRGLDRWAPAIVLSLMVYLLFGLAALPAVLLWAIAVLPGYLPAEWSGTLPFPTSSGPWIFSIGGLLLALGWFLVHLATLFALPCLATLPVRPGEALAHSLALARRRPGLTLLLGLLDAGLMVLQLLTGFLARPFTIALRTACILAALRAARPEVDARLAAVDPSVRAPGPREACSAADRPEAGP